MFESNHYLKILFSEIFIYIIDFLLLLDYNACCTHSLFLKGVVWIC